MPSDKNYRDNNYEYGVETFFFIKLHRNKTGSIVSAKLPYAMNQLQALEWAKTILPEWTVIEFT